MKNPLEFQSAERDFLVDKDRLDEIKMQEALFHSPFEFFIKVRQGYFKKSGDAIQADKEFIETFPLLINALRENFFNFPYILPDDVLKIISGNDNKEIDHEAVIEVFKKSGVTKEGLRTWVINDFEKHKSDVDQNAKMKHSFEKKSQLQLIEKIYDNK